MRIWNKWTAALLLLTWPGIMCSAQRGMFFAQNKATAHGGTASFVQACGLQTNSPTACPMSNPVGAGHLLFFTLLNAFNAVPTAVSVYGDTGTLVTDLAPVNIGFTTVMSTYYILSASGGETSIGLNVSGGDYPAVTVQEFACSPTCSLDVSGSSVGVATGSSSIASSYSITPSTPGDVIIGAFLAGGASVGTGFSGGVTNGFPGFSEYMIQSAAAPVMATANLSSSGGWAAYVIAFKP
jgi:hypothetical protein